MASKSELRDAISDARSARSSAAKAVKRLTDIHVPEQARKDRRRLIRRLRRLVRRMARRIPKLRKRLKSKRKSGGQQAAKWALSQIGKTETAGTNWGHPVQDWIIYTGYSSPVPWCGCFAAVAAVKHGKADIPTRVRLGYTPYICADGASGSNGLERISLDSVQAGDLVVFNFGSGIAKHVGVAVGPISGGLTDCVEGNTSSGDGGSQDNGGGVFRRRRPTSDVICAVRPDYR